MGKLNPHESGLLVYSDISWNSSPHRGYVTSLDLLFQPHVRPSTPHLLRSSHMGLPSVPQIHKFILSQHSIFLGHSSSYLHIADSLSLGARSKGYLIRGLPWPPSSKQLSWSHHNYIILLVLLHSLHHYLTLSDNAFVSCLFLSLPRI